MARKLLILLLSLAPALALAQSITPGKYRSEDVKAVQRAAFDPDGRGLAITQGHDGSLVLAMRFTWSVQGGKLFQKNVQFSRDMEKWLPSDDTAIEIGNITPQSFELNRMDGRARWVREP
jgi:hypothetical protein